MCNFNFHHPIAAVSHYAEAEAIESYGYEGKYKLNFVTSAKAIGPIKFSKSKQGTLQSPRYTTYEKLLIAKDVVSLFQ